MARHDRPRVLLIWPGSLFGGGGNFGVPQLLALASVLERGAGAEVDVVDLDAERAFGPVDLGRLVAPGYDVIGISCYASYDYLKVMAIGAALRRLCPESILVTGGYHVSARPDELLVDPATGAPVFHYAVVGDGEGPMLRLVQRLAAGKRPLGRVVGPEPLTDGDLVHYDWERLARYRPIARKVASQAELYLSRGCPFDCAFCMERAKRETAWRPLDPERAVEEVHRLDQFLDLSDWTLFIADALFGMKRAWRRTFLEGLARRPSRARKIWLLIRLDLIEREDLALMARANVAPGFGLESGDEGQLRRIRKSGRLDGYLDHMRQVAAWAGELGVPFGANVIVGHPGETEASMRNSAAYLKSLFLEGPSTHGFLSVDPFRLYPGSPIDEDRAGWEAETGMRVHRYPWWHDGDQDFLSEWVDPSRDLDFRRALTLRRELFDPIVRGIEARFAYQGPARDYFLRAIREQVEMTSARQTLHTLGQWHLWRGLVGRPVTGDDPELAACAREARADALTAAGIELDDDVGHALRDVPRERFVAPEHITRSARDEALPLDAFASDDEAATLSAMHAYADAFRALDLKAGDSVVELGSGTGYGATLAAALVGPEGRVRTVEVDPKLAAAAAARVPDEVEVVAGDAHDLDTWAGAHKVYVTFAVEEVPPAWLASLAPGGRLVAPVGSSEQQWLVHHQRGPDGLAIEVLHPVRYVGDRSHRG